MQMEDTSLVSGNAILSYDNGQWRHFLEMMRTCTEPIAAYHQNHYIWLFNIWIGIWSETFIVDFMIFRAVCEGSHTWIYDNDVLLALTRLGLFEDYPEVIYRLAEVGNCHVDPRFHPTLVGRNLGLRREFPTSAIARTNGYGMKPQYFVRSFCCWDSMRMKDRGPLES